MDHSQGVEAYASDIESQAVYLLQESKRRPARGAQNTSALQEAFEGMEEAPVGEHGPTYEKLKSGATKLQKMFQSNASRKEVNQKADELLATANSLPGELQPVTEPQERQEGEID